MRKIVHLANGEIFGGAERQILTLARWQARQSLVVVVLLCEGRLASCCRAAGLKTEIVGTRRPLDWVAISRLRSLLRGADASVVHVHGYRATVFAALAGVRGVAPVVRTEHGAPENRGPGLRNGIVGFAVRILDVLSGWVAGALTVFVSSDLRRRLWWRAATGPWCIIPNGIDIGPVLAACAESTRPPWSGNPIAIVGRVDYVKGVDIAISTIANLPLDLGVHLHVVGDGPLMEEGRRLAEKFELSNRVTFHGATANPFPLIEAAKLLIIASRHEGLPYVLLEAMAIGTPVVAARVGGLPEVIVHEDSGYLVDRPTAEAFAAGIADLLRNPELMRHISNQGRNLVSTKFSVDAMGSAYDRAYSAATERRSRRISRGS